MKKHTGFILAALLIVLGATGVANAQNDADRTPGKMEVFVGLSNYDIAAPWGVIDNQDVIAITLGISKTPGVDAPEAWDINADSMIDVVDIGLVSSRFGCTAADSCYWWR